MPAELAAAGPGRYAFHSCDDVGRDVSERHETFAVPHCARDWYDDGMRSTPILLLTTLGLFLSGACGDDEGTAPMCVAPVFDSTIASQPYAPCGCEADFADPWYAACNSDGDSLCSWNVLDINTFYGGTCGKKCTSDEECPAPANGFEAECRKQNCIIPCGTAEQPGCPLSNEVTGERLECVDRIEYMQCLHNNFIPKDPSP